MIILSLKVKYFPHALKTDPFIIHSVKLFHLFTLLILFAFQNVYSQENEKPETPDSTRRDVALEKPNYNAFERLPYVGLIQTTRLVWFQDYVLHR